MFSIPTEQNKQFIDNVISARLKEASDYRNDNILTSAQKSKMTQYENALKAIKQSRGYIDRNYNDVVFPTKLRFM